MNKTLRVLNIEDSERDAMLIRHHLKTSDYEIVAERVDTSAAMKISLEAKRWDVILCDYSMPQFSALAALAILKETGQDIPFIIISGTIGEEAAVEAMLAGVSDYMLKDNLTRLVPAIERGLRESEQRRARKQAELNLVESEKRLQLALTAAGMGVWEWNLKTDEAYWSPECSEILKTAELKGHISDLQNNVHPEDAEIVINKVNRAIETNSIYTAEFRYITPHGDLIWLFNHGITELGDDGIPNRLIGTVYDITERKLTEEALRQSEEQLRQSQKLESIGQLAGGIAHDFNNLLTAIIGYSELTLKRLPPKHPLERNLEEIRKAGNRAAELTRQLLAFSRKQVLQPKVFNLNSIVSEFERMLQRLIGEDVELWTILEPELGSVKADPGQIEQVIMNLAVNARDAMPLGGKLTIETKNIYLDENYAKQHITVVPGDYVMLAVTDNGSGIDEETIERIFDPFFTTKEVGKGTGLGLSTVYGIIKQSGGNIWVYSEAGYGTTFKIYLPRIGGTAQKHEQNSESGEVFQGQEVILLAEDEEMVRNLAREVLESYGYRVLEAVNGESALLICAKMQEPIHLLITDVVMPEMSGRELTERLAVLRPEMKVLYMSGYTDNAIVHHGVLDAETNFIQKPFAPAALAQKVREVLDESKSVVKNTEW